MSLIKQINEQANANEEMKRIAQHWRGYRDKMSDPQLADAVGNDLEQLEYTPDQVEAMVPTILAMIKEQS